MWAICLGVFLSFFFFLSQQHKASQHRGFADFFNVLLKDKVGAQKTFLDAWTMHLREYETSTK
jgi:hypothetical protein